MRWLLGYLEEYAGHAQTAASKGAESHDTLRADPALNQAFTELRTLLERFANGKSFSGIQQRIQVLIEDARADESLRGWFKEVDTFSRKVGFLYFYLLNFFDIDKNC